MSKINSLFDTLSTAYGQRNPIRDGYYRLFHRKIAKTLLRKGAKSFSPKALVAHDAVRFISAIEKEGIIASANNSLANRFNLLGSGNRVLDPVCWSTDFVSGYEWQVGTYYRKYVQVDLNKNVDVKLPRELSRFHFLLHLALAYHFTKEDKYLLKSKELVLDWIDKNPLMYSINWGCSMDVGIRAVNWIWGFSTIGWNVLDTDFINRISGSIYQHGWFIFHNLEGHQFRYNNNHYMSDLVGLLHIAALYKGDSQADRWFSFALREFYHEVRLQVLPSGMDYECSTNYHRLVLELIVASIVFLKRIGQTVPTDVISRCEKMFEIVYSFSMPDGTMPIVADQDNGRCLPWGTEVLNDYRYLMSLGATLFHREDFKSRSEGYNIYCALFGENDSKESFEGIKNCLSLPASQLFRDAGFAIMREGDDYLLFNLDSQGGYLDSNSTTSHSHSDWLSFVLCADSIPFIIDPGTYVYSSDSVSRNLFRSTKMHNTVVVDGHNQAIIFDNKLWDMRISGGVDLLKWKSEDSHFEISCIHSGFNRLDLPVRHQRNIKYDSEIGRWEIEDTMIGEGSHRFDAHFHLDEGVAVVVNNHTCKLSKSGKSIRVTFNSKVAIDIKLEKSLLSKSYGTKTEGTDIIVTFNCKCPVVLQTIIDKVVI